jgi:hypothetical protein
MAIYFHYCTHFPSPCSPSLYITCFILHLTLYYSLFPTDGTFVFVRLTHSIAYPLHSHTLPPLNTWSPHVHIGYQYIYFVLVVQLLYFAHISVLHFRVTIFHTILSLLHWSWRQNAPVKCRLHFTPRGAT